MWLSARKRAAPNVGVQMRVASAYRREPTRDRPVPVVVSDRGRRFAGAACTAPYDGTVPVFSAAGQGRRQVDLPENRVQAMDYTVQARAPKTQFFGAEAFEDADDTVLRWL